jgi:uncharacterized repeat protein (TIGR01451 family)
MACLGAGLASGSAMLRGQTTPDPLTPLPALQPATGAKLYYPTYKPMPGSPPPPATPNGNIPLRQAPLPSNPIIPASGSNPATLSRSVLTSPAIAPSTGGPLKSSGGTQSPCVQIEKRGPEIGYIGQPLRYDIVVRNAGLTPVQQVRVDDEIPAGVRYVGSDPPGEAAGNRLTWHIGALEPYAERHIRVDVQPPGEGELQTRATVTFSGAASLRTLVVQPRVTLAMRGPEQVAAGDPVPFQITATNTGGTAIPSLTLRGRLTDGLQHPQGSFIEADLGALGPGESRTVTLTTTAARGGVQSCEVTATPGGPDISARASVLVLEPSLQIRRTGPTRCYLKSEIGFELEVTNPGTATANDAVVTEMLPAGFEYFMASDGGNYDAATRAITWRCPALNSGAKRTVTYRVRAIAVGEQTDRATAHADRGPDAKAESVFLVEGVAALSLEVVDLEDPVEVGGELTYEVRIVNQGSCACANIQITATAPDGLQPREGSGPTSHRMQGQQLVFDPLPRLATKADVVYRIKVRGVQPGDYRFRVQMTCDQLKAPVVKEESSRVY